MKLNSNGRIRDADDRCRVCSVLARIPCTALSVFLLLLCATIACIGSLFVAFHRTRIVIEYEELWPWFLYACIGVAVGMLTVAVSYLIVASVSAVQTPKATDRQNLCLRILNCFTLVFGIILQVAWLLFTIMLGGAVLISILIYNMYYKKSKCVNLNHYAIPREPAVVCQEELIRFIDDIREKELLVCYSTSLICAVIVTLGLSLMLISTMYNYGQLKANQVNDHIRVRGSSGMRISGHLMSPYNVDGLSTSDGAL